MSLTPHVYLDSISNKNCHFTIDTYICASLLLSYNPFFMKASELALDTSIL